MNERTIKDALAHAEQWKEWWLSAEPHNLEMTPDAQFTAVDLVLLADAYLGAKEWHDQVAVIAKKWAFEHGDVHCTPKEIGDFLFNQAGEIERLRRTAAERLPNLKDDSQ